LEKEKSNALEMAKKETQERKAQEKIAPTKICIKRFAINNVENLENHALWSVEILKHKKFALDFCKFLCSSFSF